MSLSTDTTGNAAWEKFTHSETESALLPIHAEDLESNRNRFFPSHGDGTFFENEWWITNHSPETTGVLSDIGSLGQSVYSIEPAIEENTIANDRSTLFMQNPILLHNPEQASKEVNARLQILEDRLMKMVPVRTDEELAELENFVDAIERLSTSLE